jgi:hypothetical protein
MEEGGWEEEHTFKPALENVPRGTFAGESFSVIKTQNLGSFSHCAMLEHWPHKSHSSAVVDVVECKFLSLYHYNYKVASLPYSRICSCPVLLFSYSSTCNQQLTATSLSPSCRKK